MKRYLVGSFLLVSLIPGIILADIPVEKISAQAYSDMGSIVSGSFGTNKIENLYINRVGVSLTALDTINGKLRLSVGVGGIFYQALPSVGYFWQQSVKFGPGIKEAAAEYLFTPSLSLEQGYFPVKYNHPAMDLGEYLLKSESYPTALTTGGWTWVDSAYARVLGMRLKASHFDGKFQHELGIYTEIINSPFFDFTPAYLFSWKPATGVEIGGGVALRRWFSPGLGYSNAGKGGAAAVAAQYVTIANFPEVQYQAEVEYTYVDATGKQVNAHSFVVWNPGSNMDAAPILAGKTNATVTGVRMIQDGSPAGTRSGIKTFLQNMKGCSADSTTCATYLTKGDSLFSVDANGAATLDTLVKVAKVQEITRKAINVDAHFNLDFTDMLGLDKRNGSFGLYGEWAILGVQNQPVYYQKITQRMPVMMGVHIPTFGLLDLLDVETEYLDNPYIDQAFQLSGSGYDGTHGLLGSNQAIPDPFESNPNGVDYSLRKFALPSVHGDDWKWAVFATKTILPGLQLKVQVANDHMRLQYFDGDTPAGPAFGATSALPETNLLSHWYYVAHLQWGF
jgi:hypothetical protein